MLQISAAELSCTSSYAVMTVVCLTDLNLSPRETRLPQEDDRGATRKLKSEITPIKDLNMNI